MLSIVLDYLIRRHWELCGALPHTFLLLMNELLLLTVLAARDNTHALLAGGGVALELLQCFVLLIDDVVDVDGLEGLLLSTRELRVEAGVYN